MHIAFHLSLVVPSSLLSESTSFQSLPLRPSYIQDILMALIMKVLLLLKPLEFLTLQAIGDDSSTDYPSTAILHRYRDESPVP